MKEFNALRQWMKKNHQPPEYGWPEISDFQTTLGTAVISFLIN
jgi:hypothetical protein